MSAFGFSLVLAAAFCHAIWNFFIKKINGGPELVWLFSALSVLIYLPFAAYIMISQRPVFGFWEMISIAGSTGLHLSYFLLLQRGYRQGDLSLIYPIARASGPLLSTGLAFAFLGEMLTWRIALGAAIIITGVLFLTGGPGRNLKQIRTSLLFGLGVGLFIGSYTVWDAYAVSVLMIPPLLIDYASAMGRSVLLMPYALKHRDLVARHWRDHKSSVLIIAVFNALAYILVLYALTFTPVIYVAPTREISVLIAVMMGSLLLGEGHLQRRLLWGSVILAGVFVLVSG